MLIMLLTTLYYACPGMLANMAPVFLKNKLNVLAVPVDLGRKFRGKRLLGSHKTLRGFAAATVMGAIIGVVQFLLYRYPAVQSISYIEYTPGSSLLTGAVFGFGAMFGDSVKSFFKRQVGVRPGQPFMPFDQIDFLLGIALFSLFLKPMTLQMVLILLVAGFILHLLFSLLGYVLKVRKEKW